MTQPVLGSLAWMTYTMRSVIPVYDNENQILIPVILVDDASVDILISENGSILIADNVFTPGDLYRWI